MFPPPLLWHDRLEGHTLVGSVARGEFVTEDYNTSPTQLRLWQVNSPPEIKDSYEFGGSEYIYRKGENDSGKIAFVTSDGFSYKLYAVETAGEGEMSVNNTSISTGPPRQVIVSQDGAQIVLDYGDGVVYAWDYATLADAWNFDLITDSTRQSGYVAGAPRADRILWVNTSPLTLRHDYDLDITGITIAADTDFTVSYSSLPDWASTDTVDHVDLLIRVDWYPGSFYGASPVRTDLDPMTTGSGVTLSPSLSATYANEFMWTVMSVGQHAIADPGPGAYSETIHIHNVGGGTYWYPGGYWSWALLSYFIDNSDRGGGKIQLIDETGTVLDDIPNVEESGFVCSWVGTGDDSVSYFKWPGYGGYTT